MAVSSRNGEESKKLRKISLSYLKDSIVRRSGRQNGSRGRLCCETLEDANGEAADSAIYCPKDVSSDGLYCKKDLSTDGSGVRCKCSGRPLGDKQSIFKSLKKRFQLNTEICARRGKCQSNHAFKSVDSPLTEDSSTERFTSAGSRKTKGGRAICPVTQQFCFIKTSGTNCDKNNTIKLSSLQDQKEGLFKMRTLPEVENVCKLHDMSTQLLVENATNKSNVLNLPALKSNEDTENQYPIRLSTTDNFDMENSNYSESQSFMFNMNEGSLVQYDSCDIVRHPIGEIAESVASSASRSLTCELFKLAKYGWYWGPISREEAEEKLLDLPDGAFLVRDSSADRYLLSVSFRSSGKTFHTRIEHSYGLFSFYSTPSGEGFSSIVELINHSMSYSESAVFCYSRPRAPGYPSFPVRLARPVSRFTQVRSLQYLCRFVIRQYTRVDNIQKLPLPNRLKGYIQEGHY